MTTVGHHESFTSRERAYLSSLPAVERVTGDRIFYTEAFKEECMRRYCAGESASRIFAEAGMPSRLIGYKRIERAIARWSKSVSDGERGGAVPQRATDVGKPTPMDVMACMRRIEERLACIESRLDKLGGTASSMEAADTTTTTRESMEAALSAPSER
ncbi:hypothetical protein GCM10008915_07300 [Bifidobacterium pullorum subsp. gallinarum]|uniref:hypothetical protein n=1 Tax=Bifidobacterium pullorum TaxID=78448 RepID=UPI00068BCF21|nr:hypothetical protein [Bifidobacterium pullorum]